MPRRSAGTPARRRAFAGRQGACLLETFEGGRKKSSGRAPGGRRGRPPPAAGRPVARPAATGCWWSSRP